MWGGSDARYFSDYSDGLDWPTHTFAGNMGVRPPRVCVSGLRPTLLLLTVLYETAAYVCVSGLRPTTTVMYSYYSHGGTATCRDALIPSSPPLLLS